MGNCERMLLIGGGGGGGGERREGGRRGEEGCFGWPAILCIAYLSASVSTSYLYFVSMAR